MNRTRKRNGMEESRPRNPLPDNVVQAYVVNSSSSDEEGDAKTPTNEWETVSISSSSEVLGTSTLEGTPARRAADH
eukprot:77591-Pyramimonas_sp.AAC.1